MIAQVEPTQPPEPSGTEAFQSEMQTVYVVPEATAEGVVAQLTDPAPDLVAPTSPPMPIKLAGP